MKKTIEDILEKAIFEYLITIIDHNTGSIKNLGENLPKKDNIIK